MKEIPLFFYNESFTNPCNPGSGAKKGYMKVLLLRKINKINIHLPLLSLQLKNYDNHTFLTLILS